ncbi:hypothetical protein PV325_009525 [Microctonus aethiopoides]|nr:hypothetical protein PV325_009525 [Microctonus aethiopoides]
MDITTYDLLFGCNYWFNPSLAITLRKSEIRGLKPLKLIQSLILKNGGAMNFLEMLKISSTNMKQSVRSLKIPICLVQLSSSAWGKELPHVAAMWPGIGVAAKG